LDVRTIRLDELTIRRDEPEPALPSAPVQFAISAEKSKKAAVMSIDAALDRRTCEAATAA